MFICNHCGNTFQQPAEFREPHPELIGCPDESWTECPTCGDGDYTGARMCDCGNYTRNSDGLCDDCKRAAMKLFQVFMATNFTERERAYLNEKFGKEEF